MRALREHLWDATSRPNRWAIVAVNVVPLIGVVGFGWPLGVMMLLFWCENVVVGFYSIVRMAIVARAFAIIAVPFFIFHFGMFSAGHLLFVVLLFIAPPLDTDPGLADVWAVIDPHVAGLVLGVATMVVSHGISFRTNFWNGPERHALTINNTMSGAYVRVFIMHITLIAGAYPALEMGEPAWALVILVLVKLLADLASHSAEHRRAAKRVQSA